jgi:flagellar biosynthesis protein FlhG
MGPEIGPALPPNGGAVSAELEVPDALAEPGFEVGRLNGSGVAAARAASLCVVSGKGGTGKSVVTASLSTLLAARGATLIVDADLGVGNAHILQGVSPDHSFVDVADGRLSVSEIVQSCRPGLDLLSAGSGVSRMAALSAYEMHLIAGGIERLEPRYEYLVVDSAAGVSTQTAAFAATCDYVLLVTTPDLTAMTDAYAFLKVLYGRNQRADVRLVVNRVDNEEEGRRAADRICSVSERFLGRRPAEISTLPEDPAVRRAGNQRSAVVLAEPAAAISRELESLCCALVQELAERRERAGEGMGQRLVSECGFSSRY